MISILELTLVNDSVERLTCNAGSILHGVIMQQINSKYAEKLHLNGLKPYSQYVRYIREENISIWRISGISKQAIENIVMPIYNNDSKQIFIEHKNKAFNIAKKTIKHQTSYKLLADECFLGKKISRKLKIGFITPTSFKTNGEYQIIPNIESIYKSIVGKWNAFSDAIYVDDNNTLDEIIKNTKLVGYNLKSTIFHLEGVRIKSFIGDIEIYISGPEALVRLVNMLFEFATYSGIGIKNSLGMGGIGIG